MPARSDGQDGVRLRGRVQRDDHRVAGGGPDGGDQTFERLLPAADIHQNDVRTHALQAVQEIADVAQILVFDDDAERQVGEGRPAPAPRVPGFRLPARWSADTCGVSRSPVHFPAPPAAAVGARPGFGRMAAVSADRVPS